jgi:hypothetical protein
MRLLFDECVPRKVTFLFADGGHKCENVRPFETQDAALEGARTSLTATLTAVGKQECDLPGFSGKDKGDLLALAEERLDVLVTIARTLDISRT